MKALAALGMLAEEAEARGDARAVDRLHTILEAFTDVLALATLTEQRRAEDRNRKKIPRNSGNSTESAEGKSSVEIQGIPGNSAEANSSVHDTLDLKADNTPRASIAIDPSDAKAAAALEFVRVTMGDEWPDVEAFLLRRDASKWPGWLDEMQRLIGGGSQFTAADLVRVCRDDTVIEKPLGTCYGLRTFLFNARQERLAAASGDSEPRPPAGAGSARPSIGARAFATTLGAIEDL